MNAMPPVRGWSWGVIALVLAVLAWAGLVAAVLAFAASFRPPGDGDNGIQAMQLWILAALSTLVLSFVGSLVALVMAWRRQRGPVCASIAGALLVMLVSLLLLVIGANLG